VDQQGGAGMKKNKLNLMCLLLLVCYFLPAGYLSASGKKDSEEEKRLNDEWILCITAFDYSLLPQSQRIAGNVITRSLVKRLTDVDYRLRLTPEYAYYEGHAWQQSLNVAAKAISQKRDERSQLLFRGDPDWKYRQNLRRVDGDLKKLIDRYAEVEAKKPLIHNEPSFGLSRANIGGNYPEPPKAGAERRFCQGQNADAFLTGELREFFGRYFVKIRLFILYTNSYEYEDDIIFSMEDTELAVDEITGRLTAVLSGNRAAVIAIQADPPESQVLVNQSFAGRGTVAARERPPGTITVAVSAEGYTPQTFETELAAGELTEIDVNLSPLNYSNVVITVPGKIGVSVYQGTLYVGEAPLILPLPINQLEYIHVETRRGETARAVLNAPDIFEDDFNLSLTTKMPTSSGQKRVNRARHLYYWAWGGTWTAGILTWISYGIYTRQSNALPFSSSSGFYSDTQRMYYISTGAVALLGVAIAYEIFRMYRYVSIATEGTTRIVKRENQRR
jgi:hypothetical protein